MPMRLDDGWNQIQFNLSDFARWAYGTNYIETLRVQIHANSRIQWVYFSDGSTQKTASRVQTVSPSSEQGEAIIGMQLKG
ncbi:Cilia- and flagella-associated protein 20 [Sciurus carolinensis]|uniref:Cilia- and flagella-associated protein 20 n=1 Tax=Sciurus carolinensis TaxID=30640 RepID=A0AA41SUZ3_SCICA|nr:Cilia- and flagella-associated protein 20 [Sciurus carolinensis]